MRSAMIGQLGLTRAVLLPQRVLVVGAPPRDLVARADLRHGLGVVRVGQIGAARAEEDAAEVARFGTIELNGIETVLITH